MGFAVKKYRAYSPSNMQIIKGGNRKSRSFLPIISAFILIWCIIQIIGFLNSNDNLKEPKFQDTDIDWDNPPCKPSDLSAQWKEITHSERLKKSNRRDFVHEHTGMIISFEKGIRVYPETENMITGIGIIQTQLEILISI